MRVVMLTDDVPIDRRILQEAGTLIEDGHQVILLAGHSPELPAFEVLDGVRIERVAIPSYGRRELVAARGSTFAGRVINAASSRSQRLVGDVVRRCLTALQGATRVSRRLSSRAMRFGARLEHCIRRRTENHPQAPPTEYVDAAADQRRLGSGSPAIAAVQPHVANRLVSATSRVWWAAGMLNAKATPWVLTAVRRSRRVPLRDAVLATRVAYYRPDVVHAHDLPQLRAGVLAGRRLGVPVVYDAHELYPEIGTLTPRQQRQLGRIERRFIRECDEVITVNPYIAAEMAQRYRIPEPTVILNAIDANDHTERSDALRTALHIPAAHRIVLFQGWLSPTRGLNHLVDAMAFTRDETHLVFMSYGDLVDELFAHAHRLGIGHRVHFQPAVPQAELLWWSASADVGVIPYPAVDLNHHFCSPNKLFEFIQAGLPIVANDLPFLRDVIVGEGIGAVAAIEEHGRFGAELDRIAHADPAQRAQLDVRLASAAPRYDWASQESTLRTIYASAAITPRS